MTALGPRFLGMLAASALRLATRCLLVAISLVMMGVLPTVGPVVLSQSESPLEIDEASLETLVPGSTRHESRRSPRRVISRPNRRDSDRRDGTLSGRFPVTLGHRITNDLLAPLRC